MLDFLIISSKSNKKGTLEVFPKFKVGKSEDLMIRGGDFYAVWDDRVGWWSTDEEVAIRLIDAEVDKQAAELRKQLTDTDVIAKHMNDSDSGIIDKWHKYVQKQQRDSYHQLDDRIIFSNTKVTKKDYATKTLPYPMEPGSIAAYDELMNVLYSPPERHKIEWAIGSIFSGDSKYIQKFMVLYGAAGTGKSTVLNIIQQLFEGYYTAFDAKALGMSSSTFALEPFKTNPLVAIQHDGDLSHIEDNTRLNSVVSHELMTVNEKFKSAYQNQFRCFLFMGTNRPVRITDAKSGIIRRLIDVSPTGNKIPAKTYRILMSQIKFELGAIASHCLEVYKEDPDIYEDYVPYSMLGASNDFYNFVLESYEDFKNAEAITLRHAWEMYNVYCKEAKVPYPYSRMYFKEELKNYFREFAERKRVGDERCYNVYSDFRTDKFADESDLPEEKPSDYILALDSKTSAFDEIAAEYPAQYANSEGNPTRKWADVDTVLEDLNTRKLHWVKVPDNHIVIDLDLKDSNGEKSLEKNLKAASKFPKTYAELSQSGKAIHLHYIYTGDVSRLSRLYSENIEVKVYTGNASLRRKLTKCNDLPIATINSGLPLREEAKMVNFDSVKSEKGLRTLLVKNLNKEYHPATKPSVDFIYKILEDAYNGGLKYDVTDMRPTILAFAAGSTNNSEYCVKLVNKMKFKSDEPSKDVKFSEDKIIFYDVEIFPNLFVVCWKAAGNHQVVKMINPTPEEIENLIKFKLVGFNNRRYDNHMLYARLMGYNNLQLFDLSQRLINGSRNATFGEAYNLSYTDVYDFASKKQSLKKWEIELGIFHMENEYPWDQPVAEEHWGEIADYCANDVIATEAVFNARREDFVAREILADLSGLSVNASTRQHATKIIFGDDKNPELVYTDLSKTFPGYSFDAGKSTYMGEDPSEGGYVYAEPGIYHNVTVLDVASMHPHSILALNLFGEYTERFADILHARIAIKRKDFDSAKTMLGGVLKKYLTDESQADQLAQALKIVINSVYGYTTATFENPFRDIRNVDNIVAKRGALFMITLKHEVQKRGFTVAHIKTDSIKIPDATPEIIQFCKDFAKQYGYIFDEDPAYERMCLVNDAVFIARYKEPKKDKKTGKDIWWTATGTQFQVPYVFKTLFSHDPILFEDMCETKSVTTALYLDLNEGKPEGEHNYHFVGRVGQFCPIEPGCGGGILLRKKDDKYYAATGSKGFRWLESEMVRQLGKEKEIDRRYYRKLVDDAVDAISKFGDFEEFVSEDIPEQEEPVPFKGGVVIKNHK